jgi:predicted nucleic acid-binding protein
MRNAVLLDTSFLITLADPRRPRHVVAKQYFQYQTEQPKNKSEQAI